MNRENNENKPLQIKTYYGILIQEEYVFQSLQPRRITGCNDLVTACGRKLVYYFRKKTEVKTDWLCLEYLNQNISLPGIPKITKIFTAPQARIADFWLVRF